MFQHGAYRVSARVLLASLFSTTAIAQTGGFTDQTAAAGIAAYQDAGPQATGAEFLGGGAVGDFNRDGHEDLFVLCGFASPDKLYINNGDGTFTDRAAEWGVARSHRGAGVAVGDYDGNGWLDLYVTSWGPTDGAAVPGAHILYHNNGDGTFTDVAASAGVQMTSPAVVDGTGAAFGDYDLDGRLDLAVAGWFGDSGGNRLFRNNGDGTFSDVTLSAILFDMTPVRGYAPRFCDMDGDRYPELLWVADFGTSKYLINNADGTFTEATATAGTAAETNGMGGTVGDYDGDGDLDWYVSSVYYPFGTHFGNMLYRNDGPHTYTEVSDDAGVSYGGWGWGVVSIDFDHDTRLDIVETNGWFAGDWINDPARLFANNGDGTFTDRAAEMGVTYAGQGRGLANFDYDNDGDQDIVFFGYREDVRLLRNELSGPGANWLRVRLDTRRAPAVAPDGIGSRVIVTAGEVTQVRVIDAGSNYLTISEMTAHFGLADATQAQVRVEWTNGGVTELSTNLVNRTMTIRPTSARAPIGKSHASAGPFHP